jgi:altronate dehydratase small subunit
LAEQALVIDPRDHVAVALVDLRVGETCTLRVGDEVRMVEIKNEIPFGHKFALRKIERGDDVLKYGEVIGEATSGIEVGEWVHVHNLVSKRGSERIREVQR